MIPRATKDASSAANTARAADAASLCDRRGRLLPQWRWMKWTLAEHLAHLDSDKKPQAHPVQEGLFPE